MSKQSLLLTFALLIAINIVLLVAIIIVKLLSSTKCSSIKPHERIVGGRRIEIENFPFAAGIVVVRHYRLPKDTLQCGCSIISKNWVLSAAHCEHYLRQANIEIQFIVIVSNHKEWKKGVKHPVEKMIASPDFDNDFLFSDAVLFKVQKSFTSVNEVPIPIAGSDYKYEVNKTATVIGWGYNETNSNVTQETLFGVNVTIFSDSYCGDLYGEGGLTPDMFCAGAYEGGRDACQMDSGGPIVADNILIGIVSWGGDCGNQKEPGVYARVPYFHSWFKDVESQEKEKIGFEIKSFTLRK